MKYIYIVLVIVNASSFILTGYDKLKAKTKGWRIPELTLFTMAFLGGATGVLFGMHFFRHKTKHYSFKIGIPLLVGLNGLSLYYIVRYFF